MYILKDALTGEPLDPQPSELVLDEPPNRWPGMPIGHWIHGRLWWIRYWDHVLYSSAWCAPYTAQLQRQYRHQLYPVAKRGCGIEVEDEERAPDGN